MSPMTPADIAEGKRQLTVLCVALGCSGLSKRCPGDPCCSILQKIGRSQWAAETIAASQQSAGEMESRNSSPSVDISSIYIPSLISIIMIMRSMKNNIYDRLSEIATEDLFFLRAVWTRLIADRTRTPRHDFVGKCALRATLILEGRGALTPPLPHTKPIRRTSQRRS